jgi:HK97 family phage prohead protease
MMIDGYLIRSTLSDLKLVGDGRTVSGMLAPYNEVAKVNDGFGDYYEMYAPGCFERCIRSGNAAYLRVQLEHNGRWIGRGNEWRDGPAGLAADLRLDDTEGGREAAFKIRDGQTPGLSLAFMATPAGSKQQRINGRDVLVRQRIKALHHVALCMTPAYEGAQVEAVRSAPEPVGPPERLVYWQQWTERIRRA